MNVRELREKYLRFFESNGHSVHPSGSLIPYDVTGRLDESLLFNGAGMVQFKPYFRGAATPSNTRLTDAQKCVRTGDIESVGDLSHLTFFEMLGNFSFGDYFKAHAIEFAWEFLTSPSWLALDPASLCCTIFNEDDEAEAEWSRYWIGAGLEPTQKIFRLGEDTNYWPANSFTHGPPGPCGPNSEIFYWTGEGAPPSGPYTSADFLRDDEAGNWLEIWNLVFIQFEWQGHLRNPSKPSEGYEKDGMPPLPFQSIDTGMGLERTAAVLGGFKSVYDTDAFQPILKRIQSLGVKDQGEESAVAMRIIADHIRTACFCIADGILPGNNGRGYVLRRLIRRAVLKGQRVLGFEEPFFHLVYEGVVEAMGDHYTELVERRDVIVETLKNEEALFTRTVEAGFGQFLSFLRRDYLRYQAKFENLPLAQALEQGAAIQERIQVPSDYVALLPEPQRLTVLPGNVAFNLYDTFGFPLEVTQEIAEEAGMTVDLEGYEKSLLEAQERSRASSGMETVYGGNDGAQQLKVDQKTIFTGYTQLEGTGTVLAAAPTEKGIAIALDQTPFYADSGGQISDKGTLTVHGSQFSVLSVKKQDGIFVHLTEPQHPTPNAEGLIGQKAELNVAPFRRAKIKRNHTATHLLHAALRQTLGNHVTQAGSYVGPDRLRFDFTHGKAMTPEQIATVEQIVNKQVLDNDDVITYVDIAIDEAKKKGAMALFGEKYGDKVRMVEIGEFSKELCGGTHVRTTGEIGLFKIVSESSAASGVRRIEAVTGEGAYDWMLEQNRTLQEASQLLKTTPKELTHSIEKTLDQLKKARQDAQKGVAVQMDAEAEIQSVGEFKLWAKKYTDVDLKIVAQGLDNAVAQHPDLVAVAALVADGKVQFVCKIGPGAVAKGAHAGNLVRELAKITGGGGGGKPDYATAGGKDVSKVDGALASIPDLLPA